MNDLPVLVYLARHGTTELNTAGCFRGNVNVGLDAQGYRDAARLAHVFEALDISAIVHSDKKRSTQTADVIAKAKSMAAHPTPNLHAWNVGEFSGEPKDEANRIKLEYYVQHPDRPIPEGESLNEFKARVRPAIMEAADIAEEAGRPLLLVVHSSVIHELGDMFEGSHNEVLVHPGGVAALYVDRNGNYRASALLKPKKARAEQGSADTVS